MTLKPEKKIRSKAQNDAMWLLLTMYAKALNDGGFTVQAVMKETIDIDWDKDLFKRLIWDLTMEIMTGKKSSKDLTTDEVNKIYETVNRFLAEKFKITQEFPSVESLVGYSEKDLAK